MRILFLHQYFCPPGGSGNNRSLELATHWKQAGHEVTLLTSPAYFPDHLRQSKSRYELNVNGIRVIVLDVDYSHEMRFRRRIWAWLRFFFRANRRSFSLREPFDLICASSTPLTIGELGRRMAKRRGIPFVFETVDVWPDVPIGMGILKSKFWIRVAERMTQRIYEESAAIVALSEGMRDQVLSHGISHEKVHVVHNGSNPEAFPFIKRSPKAGCQVIYTGTIGLANRLDFLVDVAAKIEALGREDIRFLVVGRGNDRDRVLAYAQEKQVGLLEFRDRVPKEEVPGLLRNADLGVVTFAPYPVLEANSANKFYDYLASGLPVVLNYEGWQKKYVDEWNCGRTAPQGDLESFVAHLLELADQPALRLEMGQRGRELVLAHFDRRELAESLLHLFRKVLLGLVEEVPTTP